MELKDCYAALDGDYNEVLGRLRSERIIQKFVLRFLDDQCYKELVEAVTTKNAEEAFRAAHTLKGVCLNLGFSRLLNSVSLLCETVRGGWNDDASRLLHLVSEDYHCTIDAIHEYKNALGA